jgi:hypothetical protein
MVKESTELISNLNKEQVMEYVIMNQEKLMNLRISVENIVNEIVNIIMYTKTGYSDKILTLCKPIYVGFAINDDTKKQLIKFVHQHGIYNEQEYVHHCTQIFYGKDTMKNDFVPCKPGTVCYATTDALVVRLKDNACAFRINSIVDINGHPINIKNKVPHITATLPNGLSPSVSNQFVGLDDDTVKVYSYYENISLITFWF